MALRELLVTIWFLAFTGVCSYNCDGKPFDLVCGDNGVRFKNPCSMTHYNFYNRVDIRRSSEDLCTPKSDQCNCNSTTTCRESSVPICGYNLKTAEVESFRNFCHFECEANCRSEISFQHCGNCSIQSSEHKYHQCLASTIKAHRSGSQSYQNISATASRKPETKRRYVQTSVKPVVGYVTVVTSPSSSKSDDARTNGATSAAPIVVVVNTSAINAGPSNPTYGTRFYGNDSMQPAFTAVTENYPTAIASSTPKATLKPQSQVNQSGSDYNLTVPEGSSSQPPVQYVSNKKGVLYAQGRIADTYSSTRDPAMVPRSEPRKHQRSGTKQTKPYSITEPTTEKFKEPETPTTTYYTTMTTRKVAVTSTTVAESSFERFYRTRVRQPDHYHFYQLKPTLVK